MPDDILTIYAASQPDKPGVIDDRPDGTVVTWTYAELEAQSNRVANLLLALGAAPRANVLWCGPNSPDVVAVMGATRKIGAVAVPLNYRLTPDEALYVINHSDAEIAYVDHEHLPLFDALDGQLEKVRHIIVVGGPAPDGLLGAADIAAASAVAPTPAEQPGGSMIYTSGTTGKPKGAYRSGGQDPEVLGALLNLFAYRPDDVYITSGPLYHSGPSAFMGAALLFGQTIIVQRRFDAEDWLRLVDKYGASSTFSAPALIRMVCALPAAVKDRYDRSSMRVMIANAAPWSYALKQQYVADFPPESLFEVYGSTELGVDTVLLPADQLRKPGSCGQPAPKIEIKLFDDDGDEVDRHRARAHGRGVRPVHGRVRHLLQERRQLRGEQPRRLPHGRRHRVLGRRGLPVHLRPQERHDHHRRDERLPGRDRGGPRAASRHLRRRRVRDPVRAVGRGRARHRGPGAGVVADRRGDHRVRPRAPGQLQGAPVGRLHRRAAAHRLRQDPQAPAPGAVLGRPDRPGRVAA